jgi:hypothetical protein
MRGLPAKLQGQSRNLHMVVCTSFLGKEEQPSWLCLFCRFGGQQNTPHDLFMEPLFGNRE